jgi:hypothetical protein
MVTEGFAQGMAGHAALDFQSFGGGPNNAVGLNAADGLFASLF